MYYLTCSTSSHGLVSIDIDVQALRTALLCVHKTRTFQAEPTEVGLFLALMHSRIICQEGLGARIPTRSSAVCARFLPKVHAAPILSQRAFCLVAYRDSQLRGFDGRATCVHE